MNAKDFSLIGMIVSAIVILVGGVFLFILDRLVIESAVALLIIGLGIGFVFAPVSLSIFMDKLIELKKGR